uniref:Nucleolus and neural progenitor protein-like N-terminal domain-containing protein n=1 Tax=Glossina morsitans morsitans TaxID=37546 RepID=A0A1B0FDM3_GLOMM
MHRIDLDRYVNSMIEKVISCYPHGWKIPQEMDYRWNNFDLKRPPFITIPTKYSKFVPLLHAGIDEYFCIHGTYDEIFNETAALLSRLIARRKNSFRRMHGFRDICKLNAALCRLLRVDFGNELDIFRSSLPDVAYEDGTEIYIPARECYDFLLLRLIAVHKLYERIQNCCTKAADYFLHQIKVYHFFEISTLLLAVLAKINDLSMKLGDLSTNLYRRLLPFRVKLPRNIKPNASSEPEFVFPKKLEEFDKKRVCDPSFSSLQDTTQMEEKLNHLLKADSTLAPVRAKCFRKIDIGALEKLILVLKWSAKKKEEQKPLTLTN